MSFQCIQTRQLWAVGRPIVAWTRVRFACLHTRQTVRIASVSVVRPGTMVDSGSFVAPVEEGWSPSSYVMHLGCYAGGGVEAERRVPGLERAVAQVRHCEPPQFPVS